MRIVVIIPALNEESSLPKVLGDIPKHLVDEIVVVDNGSHDETAAAALRAGASVVHEPVSGYGRACLAGIRYLRRRPPDVVVFVDADFSDRPSEMPALVSPILSHQADFVVGSRVLGVRERGALAPHARLGNWIATWMIRLLYGYRFSDLGPFRAIRYDTLLALDMQDQDYGWTAEMQAKAARAGVRATEVPVSYHRRIGRSKITGTVKGTVLAGYKIITTILKLRFLGAVEVAASKASLRSS
ncbi:MAG TPA: glycosyltransferase family 2 protein [Vicinamibacteria bacterium]|nr:glycosyltransferase family 2 protein [Vicinamibacteria bacterium]